MDERARQFKEDAESKLNGDALVKEIAKLRKFLFRNQEYRFTKSAQACLYAAVMAHNANESAHEIPCKGSSFGEVPILELVDDALKMPFNVFSSSQKDKLLAVYWKLLGTESEKCSTPSRLATRRLTLIDVTPGAAGTPASLILITENGDDYTENVIVKDAAVVDKLMAALEDDTEVVVTVSENSASNEVLFLSYMA